MITLSLLSALIPLNLMIASPPRFRVLSSTYYAITLPAFEDSSLNLAQLTNFLNTFNRFA